MSAKNQPGHDPSTSIKSGITRQGQAYEIGFENGYKVLNSQNANYSYGSLHQIMQKGIFESLKLIKPEKILLLGLGAGSAVDILNKKCHWPIEIIAVEFDADIIRLAKDEFDITRFNNLEITEADAFEWIKGNPELQYDLIIDDIFVDDRVPYACLEHDYLSDITKHLKENGIYFRNMMNNVEEENQAYERLLGTFFRSVNTFKAKKYANRIYLCKR